MSLDPAHNRKHAERVHASKRAMERYQLDYTRKVRFAFLNILKSKRIAVQKEFKQAMVCILRYENKPYRIVYDKYRNEIITFLPLGIDL